MIGSRTMLRSVFQAASIRLGHRGGGLSVFSAVAGIAVAGIAVAGIVVTDIAVAGIAVAGIAVL